MEVLKDCIKKSGWHLTQNGLNTCLANETIKTAKKNGCKLSNHAIENAALKLDLYKFGEACLPDLKKESVKKLSEDIILQVSKIRNVSAPTYNQTSDYAPRMLTLFLSDGKKSLQCIEHERLLDLSLETPPGTKIKLLKGTRITKQGICMLDRNHAKVLGGSVDGLIKKWQANMKRNESCQHFNLCNPPPPFVPFGKYIDARYKKGTITKGLLADEIDKQEKEESEFDIKRNNMIDDIGQKKTKKLKHKTFQIQGEESLIDNFRNARQLPKIQKKKFHQYDKKNNTCDENQDKINKLTEMGFNYKLASRQLREHNGSLEDALESLLKEKNNRKGNFEHKEYLEVSSLAKDSKILSDQFIGKVKYSNEGSITISSNKAKSSTSIDENDTKLVSINQQLLAISIAEDSPIKQKTYNPNQNLKFKEKKSYNFENSKKKNNKRFKKNYQNSLNTVQKQMSDNQSEYTDFRIPNLTRKESVYTTNFDDSFYNSTEYRFSNEQIQRKNSCGVKRSTKKTNGKGFHRNFNQSKHNNANSNPLTSRKQPAVLNPEFKLNMFNQNQSSYMSSNLNKKNNVHRKIINSQGTASSIDKKELNRSEYIVGDKVMAKYWEDDKFYEATVINVHPTEPFAVVQFNNYGNCEELEFDKIFTGKL